MVKVSGAVIIELLGNAGDPVRYTCDNTNPDISKGDLLFLEEPRGVSGANLATGPAAGVAAATKESGDGSTSVSVYTNGLFDVVAGNTAGMMTGTLVRISGGNYVTTATAAQFLSGMVLGRLCEDASDQEYVVVKLGVI